MLSKAGGIFFNTVQFIVLNICKGITVHMHIGITKGAQCCSSCIILKGNISQPQM